jgi:hypothetical protein
MKTAEPNQPLHTWWTVLNEWMLWFKRTGGYIILTDVANKLDISCASAYSIMLEELG